MELRDQILSINDIKIESLVIPEWNNLEVFIRSITAPERDAYEATFRKEVTTVKRGRVKKESKFVMDNARAKLAVLSLCKSLTDPTRLFSDDDIPALKKKSAAALDRIYDKASRLAGITDEDIEELAGN